MKVLVFGQTGQVARALIAVGSARGVVVQTLSRGAVDLSDLNGIVSAIGATDADAVINAAAWTAVDAAEENEAAALIINAEAPGAMARACADRDLPFLQISTDYVFGGNLDRPWTPQDATGPLSAYGRTKLAGEEAVRAAGGRAVILRTAWIFDGEGKNFVTTMLRLAETRTELNVVADQTGGPTPASAIAEACLTISEALVDKTGQGGIHHFSGSPDISWANFARAIFRAAGREVAVTDITTEQYPTTAARPTNSRLDCISLKAAFGIDRPDWEDALRSIVEEMTA